MFFSQQMHTMPLPPHIATAGTVMPGGGGHDNAGGGVVARSGLPSHGNVPKHGSKTAYQGGGSSMWTPS